MRTRILLAGCCCVLLIAAAIWGTTNGTAPAGWEKVHAGNGITVYRSPTVPPAFLVAGKESAVLIDAPAGPEELPKPPVPITAVFLTHHHRDTVAGAGKWVQAKIPVRASKLSADWLTKANVTKFWAESVPLRNSRTAYFVLPEGIDGIECSLDDNQTFEFPGFTVKAIATPGHSRDHFAYSVTPAGEPKLPWLFTGDAVTSNGKLWTPYTTDWDHWTDVGLKPMGESLRKLAAMKPAAVFPARGEPVFADPAKLLTSTAEAVEEAGFLKSFERFTNRLGNPPQYDFLVPKEQVASGGDKPWSKVSDHLWITGNTYVLATKDKSACLVMDPWGQRSVDQIDKLRKAESIGPIELVVFSHAHYDHYDGVYILPGKDGYKVWALDSVAEPLIDPFKLRAPFLDHRPIVFDKLYADGEAGTWREYTLKFRSLPGQTAFTCGIETTIDGKRCFFTADNFFHQNQFSGSGGWMGLNRSSPAVYGESAKKVLDSAPEWVLAEHGGPYVFDAEDYRRRVKWGEAAGKAADALCVSGNHKQDWTPHTVSVEPMRVLAKPAAEVSAVIRLAPRKEPISLRLQGRGIIPDQTFEFPAGPEKGSHKNFQLKLPAALGKGRYVFAVSALSGEFTDSYFVVDIE